MNYLAEVLRDFLQDELLYRLVLTAVTIILAYIFSKLMGFLTKKILNPFVAKTELDDKRLNISESGLYKTVFTSGFFLHWISLNAVSALNQGYLTRH